MELKQKQIEALEILWQKKRLFLHWSAGLGKTFVCVFAIKKWWVDTKKCHRALFVTTPGAYKSIIEACDLHGLSNKYYSVLDSSGKREEFLSGKFKPLTILSYDFLRQKQNIFMQKSWRRDWNMPVRGIIPERFRPNFIVLDESHKLKSEKSQTGKACCWLGRINPEYMVMGTATPIGKNQLDLFTQYYALDRGARLGRDFWNFRTKYFKDKNERLAGFLGYSPELILRPEKERELNDAIADVTHYRSLSKEPDLILPKKKVFTIFVNLTEEQKKLNKTLGQRALLEFKAQVGKFTDKKITATQFYTSTLSRMSAFRQVCSGFVYGKEVGVEGSVMRVKSNKIKALRAGLLKIPFLEKTIIWSVYNESFKIIMELLDEMGLQYALVTGKITGRKRLDAIERFKTDPNCRIFLSHPRAGGVGLNLQCAKYAFYFSKDYSLIDKVQSEGRNMRMDSINWYKEIIEIELRTRGSIEDEIDANIHKKKALVENFEKYLQKFE